LRLLEAKQIKTDQAKAEAVGALKEHLTFGRFRAEVIGSSALAGPNLALASYFAQSQRVSIGDLLVRSAPYLSEQELRTRLMELAENTPQEERSFDAIVRFLEHHPMQKLEPELWLGCFHLLLNASRKISPELDQNLKAASQHFPMMPSANSDRRRARLRRSNDPVVSAYLQVDEWTGNQFQPWWPQ
jgi:hypothetical protein